MSQVYFVHAPSVNLLKIGRSADPDRRFHELRLLSPVPLVVIGVVNGGSSVEAEFHKRFDHLRSHGEWFHATGELVRFAQTESLASAWNAASPDARQEFLLRIEQPVMDRRFGGS